MLYSFTDFTHDSIIIHLYSSDEDSENTLKFVFVVTVDLTKLYNYRYLMQYHEAALKRCRRNKEKVSLLFIDVDDFRRINSRSI
jgi:PleD family two-component response regulator